MASITKRKILIVDDEPDTRLFISNLLSTHGYSIVLAKTGTEGLRRVLAEKPAVIIIDMMIPNDGGIRLYRDLKRNPELDRIPIIMLSTIARKTFFKWQKARSSGTGGPHPEQICTWDSPLRPMNSCWLSKSFRIQNSWTDRRR